MKTYLTMMKRINMNTVIARLLLLLAGTVATLQLAAQNLNTPNKRGPMGVEVNTYSGNLFLPRTDIRIPARSFTISVSFFYSSYNYDINEGFGKGWLFAYHIRYRNDSAGAKTILWGDGREDTYEAVSGGAFKSPPGFFNILTAYQPSKLLLTEKDGTKYYFDNAVHRRITRMEEPNGNYFTFNYTDSLLTSITSKAGQSVLFAYTNGRLTTATDATASPARVYNYTYDEAGHLTKVTDPLGGTNLYTYLVNGPVKTVTDKNSNVIDVIYYNDLSVSEVIGCNKRISFSYDTTTHISYVTEHMNEGQNQVTKYEYKNAGNRFWLAAVSGNCCGFSKKFEFDDNGNKIKETDANGQVYAYTYDARGNLLTVKDPLGQLKKYTYSADFSKLTGYTDPKGNVYTITYDAKGNITQFTEPGNNVYTAMYNINGDIISSTDAKGLTYTYDYDAYGNLSAVNGPNGYHTTFTHDARGNLLSLTNGRNNTYTAEYDFLDRVKKVTDPLNDAIRFSYDAEGNPVSFSNKNSEIFNLGYDASNRIVKLTDPAGAQRRFSYNAMDNLTGITNPLGYAKTFSYDTRNRFSGFRDELNNSMTLSYDANGNITGISLPTGEQISCSYDNLNRIISAQDATGTLGAYTYDGNNNITSITNASGAVTALTWDNLNRLTKATDPLGNSASVAYDKNGNVTAITDRNGFTRSYTYDDLNRMKTYTGNNGDVMTVDYDGEGNISQVKDANNNITSYTYDNLNRMSTVTYPDGRYIQLTYDKKSNVTAKRLTDGSVITFQYDALSRLTSKTLPDGNVFAYTYDAAGRLLTATNNAGTVTFEYDAKDRVVSETFAGLTVRYTYNVQGRTQTTIYPDNTVVTQNYDMRNRLTSIVKNNQPVVTYQYNNSNQVTSKAYGNGVNTSLQYDFANRLSSLSTAAGAIQQSSFAYDKERNKTAITRLNPAFSEQFTYDNGYRLKTHKLGSTDNSYQYDAQGNRTNTVLNGVSSSYTVNNLNQLTGVSGGRNISFTYDNNGNLTYDGLFYKKYDAEGRLLKDSSSPSNVLTYLYDAVGRRVQKVSNGTVYNYTFSGLSQIEERNGAGTLAARTVFADFMSPVLLEKNSNVYYYHADDHYSIEAITDIAGNLAERYQYDAFGKPVIYDASGNVLNTPVSGNRFGFTGQLYDSASGNYRFHYRDYSPVNGVFNQRDPLGYGDGMAMYQYVHNNPANGIDILGLQDCPPPPTTVDPPQNIWQWILYNSGLLGNSADITSILQEYGMVTNGLQNVAKVVTNTGLSVLLTIPNAISTANTARDLGSNWDSYSNGQRVDGIISLGSGSLSTGLGITTAGYTANGLMAGQGLTASLGSAGAAVTATTSGAVLVGVGGGLAIYGLTNEMVKALTGRSIAEHGEAAEIPLFTSGVRTTSSWWYTKKVQHGEGWTQENQEKWDRIRQRIENGERLRPKQDCPQNNDPNGPQRNGPGGGGGQNGSTHVVASFDPNEIIGPDGMPDKRWVSVNDRLPYTILFENDKSASAPAKYVKVVLPFHEKMDPASFQLGTFGFNSLTFTIAPGTASAYQRLDCRDSLGLYVDMTAGYDVLKNQAFWEFQSIDPVTLLPPSDPLKGFLLLQDTAKLTSGHGFVNFSIKPVSTARTLDSILATANIVFDSNDTIPTNITRNTIDAVAPVSHLNSMPANVTNTVALSWGGTDDVNGSGLNYYTLYVSTDGINYQIVRSGITRTDTTFSSKPGNRYYFFVLATDSVGNTEVLRPGEVKSVYIGTALPVTWLYFNGSTHNKNNILDWATASEQNSKEFRVERSFDGVNFTGIGVVASRGNVAAGSTYQYTDYNIDKLNSKVMYYRLKQVDIDGNFKYSGIVRLTYDVKDRTASLVYPNPTQGLVTVVVGDSKLVGTEAHVYDEGGKLLEVIKITGSSQLFNLGKYQNGVYFIRLSNQEILKVIKRS